jgi:penicillin-binding protein 1A
LEGSSLKPYADEEQRSEEESDPEAAGVGQKPGAARRRRRGLLAGFGLLLASMAALLLNMALVALVGAAVFVAVTLTELPRTESLREVRLQEPLRVYSADGDLMAEFGVQRRSPVSFGEIPPMLVNAFLATEDSRFFEHEGVDITGLGRAALSYLRTGERSQGGSTITMQVARNFFLSREKTFQRKFAELLLSLHIERTLSKQEILELYLNKIFFGHRAYGISAAAELYYDKALGALTLPQMAMLAGIPKAPSANNPVSNPERARARRDYILGRMLELGYIDAAEHDRAVSAPDDAQLRRRAVDLEAGYLAEMVRREMVARFGDDAYQEGFRVTTTLDGRLQGMAQAAVRRALLDYDRRHGYRGPEVQHDIAGLGDPALDALLEKSRALPDLTAGIVTRAGAKEAEVYLGQGRRERLTLSQVSWARRWKDEDSKGTAPRRVSDAVAPGDLIRLRKTDDGDWELSQRPHVAGALAVVDPRDGTVRALVGGYEFDDSKFNRAVDANRQPGSSFKPIVYAAALDKGWTPASLIKDERISIRLNNREVWEPDNFDHKTMGPIRLRLALTKSRNLASIYLLERVGLDDARTFAGRFGFDLEDLPLGLSMALGTAAASPLQMAGAYAVFANGGFRVMPHYITRVENGAGDVIYESQAPRACADCWFRYQEEDATVRPLTAARADAPEAVRVLEPRLTYQMNSILGDVIRFGTARKALQLGRDDLAGKTGTTNEVRDSWFCGYQKDLVAVAWMGFDDFSPLGKGETGGQAALGMWVDFMREALAEKPQAVLEVPEGMVEVRISKTTGSRTSATGNGTLVEWIRQEYELALAGPVPVRYTGGGGGGSRAEARAPAAPRVIDELF